MKEISADILKQFRYIFDASMDMMVVVSQSTNKLRMLNPGMCSLIGYSEAELVGDDICSFVDKEDAYALQAAIQHGSFNRLMVKTVDRDGIYRHLEWSGSRAAGDDLFLIARDMTDDVVMKNELRNLAHFDGVTGLPNRYLFEDRVQQGLAQSHRENRLSGLVYIDLDDFKPVNDTYGHDIGDFVLRTVSTRLQAAVRPTDTVSRIGGDEFCVFLPLLRDEPLIELITSRLTSSIAAPIIAPGCADEILIGASCGVALYSRDGDDLATLMRAADKRMYVSKSKKADRVRA